MWKLCIACLVVCFVGSTFGQRDIRRPPTITKNPSPKNIYRSDDEVKLECKADGIPDVSYEWKKNGFELNQNLPNIHKGADGTISIKPATSRDEGFYQCFASNLYGTALSITARIQRAVLDSSAGTPTVLQKTVQEGMPFHIQAEPRKSFPKPMYGWEMAADTVDKNPVGLRLSKRVQIAENGDLYFAFALPEDGANQRIYKCTTYNPYLDVKAGGSYTQLTVTPNPGGVSEFAPTLGFSSEEQTVAVIGGSVTLRCFFSGNPEPSISWSGPRNTLPIGRYELNPFNTEITIKNITAADEGDYVCTASNTQGRNTRILQIRVEAAPRFPDVKDGPYDVNVTESESLTFTCKTSAKPEAKIVWLQNGKELDPNNPPKRFVFSNDVKSLTIKEVCRSCSDRESQTDLSVIQCNASNDHGYAFASGYFNILRKTEVTIYDVTEVIVNTNEEGQVQFECRATSDPSTPPTFRWGREKAKGFEQLHNDPPFVTVRDGLLMIHVPAKAIEKWSKYLGQYVCIVNTGHSQVNQTANIYAAVTTVAVTTVAVTTVAVPTVEKDLWIWISTGVFGVLIVFFVICCAVFKYKRNRRGKRCNIANHAKREALTSGIDSSYPLYETIPDQVFTDLVSTQNIQSPFPRDDGLNTAPSTRSQNPIVQSLSLGVGIGYRQSNTSETAAGEVNTPRVFNRANCSTTVDAATQTDNPKMECHCALCGTSQKKEHSRSEYMALAERNLGTSSLYAELQQV